jgi:hypothetical protein
MPRVPDPVQQAPRSVTAPALQRTAPRRAALRPGHGLSGYQSPANSFNSGASKSFSQEPAMSKPSIEQTRMGTEAIAFCIARTLIERDPSLKAPMRANLRKMWELLEARADHAAADMVDTMRWCKPARNTATLLRRSRPRSFVRI